MPSTAMATYDRLRTDVDTLLNYHPAIVDQKSGRPPGDTGPLLRAAIVLIYTAWENYFENVIEETFNKILTHIDDDHTLLPHHLRDVVAKHAQKRTLGILWAMDGRQSPGTMWPYR